MKLWVDDIRPAPNGYVWCKSVNEAKEAITLRETLHGLIWPFETSDQYIERFKLIDIGSDEIHFHTISIRSFF